MLLHVEVRGRPVAAEGLVNVMDEGLGEDDVPDEVCLSFFELGEWKDTLHGIHVTSTSFRGKSCT